MQTYDATALAQHIRENQHEVVLFGAGILGKLAHYALAQLGVRVASFCDSNRSKQGTEYCGLPVISREHLATKSPNTHVFICNNYLSFLSTELLRMGFSNLYHCMGLLDGREFPSVELGLQAPAIRRNVELHRGSCSKFDEERASVRSGRMYAKYVDVVITERCSLKCQDCSNLMQYYVAPRNVDREVLFRSLDRLMECVDGVYEFRVIGGEPFMNKHLHEVVNHLAKYDHANRIVLYTNGTIVPRGENLDCLLHPKVSLYVTEYPKLRTNHARVISLLEAHGIEFIKETALTWDMSGRIQYQGKSSEELEHQFLNCCVKDVLTLLHGQLYRCPFSAHSTNLEAVPRAAEDIVDLDGPEYTAEVTRARIRDLYYRENYLEACRYCHGRGYDSEQIEAGIQAKSPLSIPRPVLS